MIGSQLPAATQAGNGTRDAITAPPPATPARAHRSYLELAAVPGAVPYARRHTRHILATWKLSYLTDDAELVVSELITNAVQATPATPHAAPVALYLAADGDRLSVLAWDCSPEPPVHRPHNDDAVSGRGLEIIQALTDRCGTCVTGRGGKVVWAWFDLDTSGQALDAQESHARRRGPGKGPAMATTTTDSQP